MWSGSRPGSRQPLEARPRVPNPQKPGRKKMGCHIYKSAQAATGACGGKKITYTRSAYTQIQTSRPCTVLYSALGSLGRSAFLMVSPRVHDNEVRRSWLSRESGPVGSSGPVIPKGRPRTFKNNTAVTPSGVFLKSNVVHCEVCFWVHNRVLFILFGVKIPIP